MFNHKRIGATLIEAIVSLVILGMMSVGYLTLIQGTYTSLDYSKRQTIAQSAALSKIQEYSTKNYADVGSGEPRSTIDSVNKLDRAVIVTGTTPDPLTVNIVVYKTGADDPIITLSLTKTLMDIVIPSHGKKLFDSPNTYVWTPPAGVTKIWLSICGGGGGGAGGSIYGTGGGGGGASYMAQELNIPTGDIAIVVGSGGTGGIFNTNGANGGTSSFGSYFTAPGGQGGKSGPGGWLGGGAGGPGGSSGYEGDIGDFNQAAYGSQGGSTHFGTGGFGGAYYASPNGKKGSGYGSGGGGGAGSAEGSNGSGGDGQPGMVLIEW